MQFELMVKRDEILRRVARGDLDRNTGQAMADELGLGALLPTPDLTAPLYDPMREPRWTLLMAVTWVAFRRLSIVQKYSNVVRSATGYWQPSGSGFVVAIERPVWLHPIPSTLHDDEFATVFGPEASFIKGWQRLRQTLAAGEVRGYGRDLTKGLNADVDQIPAENWNSLNICSVSGEDGLRMRFSDAARYISIEIDRVTLLEAFPSVEQSTVSEAGRQPLALVRPEENPQPVARIPKQDSPERAAISAYIDEEHGGVWPSMSDAVLVQRAHDWVKASEARRKAFPVMKLSKSVAIRHPRRPRRSK